MHLSNRRDDENAREVKHLAFKKVHMPLKNKGMYTAPVWL